MRDYKARRVTKRRRPLKGRLPFLKRRKSQELPKGFRPLAKLDPLPPSTPPRPDSPFQLGQWFQAARPARWAYAGILALVIAGMAIQGWQAWHGTLDRVRVSGNTTLPSKLIVDTAGLTAGMRLGDVDPFSVAIRLRQDTRVESADARRIYPHTVWIDVKERIPDARVLLAEGKAALIDRHDVVIRIEQARAGDLPLIRGVKGPVQPGVPLMDPGLTRARIFLTEAKDAGVAGIDHAILDVSDPDSITVLGGKTSRLIFPVETADAALALYRRLADPSVAPAVAQAMNGASQVDLRFAVGSDGGRLFLKP